LYFSRLTGASVSALAALGAILPLAPLPQPPPPAPYTIVSAQGRRPLPARIVGGQEMFALEDLARLFELTVREDALAGGVTVTGRSETIVLTAGQSLASVGGRLISLPAPPTRDGRAWYVPVDFVGRALGPAIGARVDLRRPSRLIIVGDIRVPRITGRVEAAGPAAARVTLDVAPAAQHTLAQDGQRLVIRFTADALDAALPASTVPELVQAVRPGDAPASIVIDLGPRFASYRATNTPGDRGAARITIEIAAQTTAEPPQPGTPPPTAPPAPEQPPLLEVSPAGALRTIVIDPGHGGDETGARGPNGALEKDVTLSIARRLKGLLEARLGIRTILTRDGDQTVGLDERAAFANNNKADLFLSLHASASVRPSASGAEVFFLSLEEYGDVAQMVAQAERVPVAVFGGGTRDIEVIRWELAQARYIEQSSLLASTIEAALRERVPMSPRGLQQAPFRVLVGANMPAALVEVGFLTNPAQEQQLTTDTFQNALVGALLESVIRFRNNRIATAPAAQPMPTPGGGQ
jgi:N-acetylmuramoyl-L-alanine amidase